MSKPEKKLKLPSQPSNPNQTGTQDVTDEQLQQVVGGHSDIPLPHGPNWQPLPGGHPWDVTSLPDSF